MDTVTTNVSTYVRSKGISITAIAAGTDIPYSSLWSSLSGKRSLKGSELLKICEFLEKDPLAFAPLVQKGETQ